MTALTLKKAPKIHFPMNFECFYEFILNVSFTDNKEVRDK